MEVFKVAQRRFQQCHPHCLALRMRRFEGFFGTFPRSQKSAEPGVRVKGCTRTRAHPRRRFSGRPRGLPTTSSTWSAMGAGGGASRIRLNSGTAGGLPLRRGPGWARSYGGPRGLSVVVMVVLVIMQLEIQQSFLSMILEVDWTVWRRLLRESDPLTRGLQPVQSDTARSFHCLRRALGFDGLGVSAIVLQERGRNLLKEE